MSFKLNVVSFNVGSLNDWQNLHARALLKQENSIEFKPTNPNQLERQEVFNEKLRIEVENQIQNNDLIIKKHNDLVKANLIALIDNFAPDVFCLQEYEKSREEYQSLRNVFQEKGYTVIAAKNDLAVVYKTKKFNPVNNGILTFNEQLNEAQELSPFPALYVDLQEIASNKIVRVVTDHVKGFDGVDKKNLTNKKIKKNNVKDDMSARLTDYIRIANEGNTTDFKSMSGDAALDLSLNVIDKEDPDFIIYGLDANTTSKEVSDNKTKRLHPQRMRLFQLYKFVLDPGKTPTIRDGNHAGSVKYDYIGAKSNDNNHSVRIINTYIDGINTEDMLDNPGKLMSDHLPNLATIIFSLITIKNVAAVGRGELGLSILTEEMEKYWSKSADSPEIIKFYKKAIKAKRIYQQNSFFSLWFSFIHKLGFGALAKAEKLISNIEKEKVRGS